MSQREARECGFPLVGAGQQATALARRAAAHVLLDDLDAVTRLLRALRAAGAAEQAAALASRLPGAGMFELFRVDPRCS
jgi:hypothetical protein